MKTLNERIAVLEQKLEDNELANTKIQTTLDDMRGDLNKYKGFFGAITFIVSCIGVFFTAWSPFRGS